MSFRLCPRRLPALLVATSMLLPIAAGAASAGSPIGGPATAGAAIGLQVRVPAVLRLLDNRHPTRVASTAPGGHTVLQELVVLSNLRGGFCATLRLAEGTAAGWQVRSTDPVGTVQAMGEGYRVCAHAPGRHTLRLEHRFAGTGPGAAPAMDWPVVTELFVP